MPSVLLPLKFQELVGLEDRQISFIEQAVTLAIEKDAKLIIAIECQEIKTNAKCIDAIWERVQAFLGRIYVVQLNKSYQAEKPLFDCNVVFQNICAYTVHLESCISIVCLPEQGKETFSLETRETNIRIDSDKVKEWNASRKDSPLTCHLLTDNHNNKHSNLIENTGPIEPLVFNRVAVGGTFDQLHAGHKILLTMTALLATKSMVVGVTGKGGKHS